MVLVTSWYVAIDSDRTYHRRVTECNLIPLALEKKIGKAEVRSDHNVFPVLLQ